MAIRDVYIQAAACPGLPRHIALTEDYRTKKEGLSLRDALPVIVS